MQQHEDTKNKAAADETKNKAAAVKEPEKPVYTDEHPEYPKLLYNHETRQAKGAKDKEGQEKLAGEGYVEDPLPPEDPASLTPAEVEQLKALLAKAAQALAKLGELSKQQQEPKKPAGGKAA